MNNYYDNNYFDFWKYFIKNFNDNKSFNVNCRCTVIKLSNCDLKLHTFDARLLIDMEFDYEYFLNLINNNKDRFELIDDETKIKDNKTNLVFDSFDPKLIFVNVDDVKELFKWVKYKQKKKLKLFCYEIIATFSTEMHPFFFPFELIKARAVISSDWDNNFLSINPLNEKCNIFQKKPSEALATKYVLSNSLKIEKLDPSIGSLGLKYDEIGIITMLYRQTFGTAVTSLIRPLSITQLGFAIFWIHLNNELSNSDNQQVMKERIAFLTGLITASSVALIKMDMEYTTILDVATQYSFLFLITLAAESVYILNVLNDSEYSSEMVTQLNILDQQILWVFFILWLISSISIVLTGIFKYISNFITLRNFNRENRGFMRSLNDQKELHNDNNTSIKVQVEQ